MMSRIVFGCVAGLFVVLQPLGCSSNPPGGKATLSLSQEFHGQRVLQIGDLSLDEPDGTGVDAAPPAAEAAAPFNTVVVDSIAYSVPHNMHHVETTLPLCRMYPSTIQVRSEDGKDYCLAFQRLGYRSGVPMADWLAPERYVQGSSIDRLVNFIAHKTLEGTPLEPFAFHKVVRIYHGLESWEGHSVSHSFALFEPMGASAGAGIKVLSNLKNPTEADVRNIIAQIAVQQARMMQLGLPAYRDIRADSFLVTSDTTVLQPSPFSRFASCPEFFMPSRSEQMVPTDAQFVSATAPEKHGIVAREDRDEPALVWAIGALAYHLFTGEPLISAGHALHVARSLAGVIGATPEHLIDPTVRAFLADTMRDGAFRLGDKLLAKGVTEDGIDFIALATRWDADERPTLAELLRHPFLREHAMTLLSKEASGSPAHGAHAAAASLSDLISGNVARFLAGDDL